MKNLTNTQFVDSKHKFSVIPSMGVFKMEGQSLQGAFGKILVSYADKNADKTNRDFRVFFRAGGR